MINKADTRSQIDLEIKISNEIPSVEGENVLQEMLSHERRCRSELDLEIARLEPILNKLYEQREDSDNRINKLSFALAPHKRLPSEILARIFLDSIGEEGLVLPPGRNQSPWTLLSVSSRWRTIAFAEQRLWNNLIVHAQPTYPIQEMLEKLFLLLWAPTQTFQTSLTLQIGHQNISVRDIIFSYSHRLSTIEMYTHADVISTFLFGSEYSLNSLETLKLSIPEDDTVDTPLGSFITAPKLRSITISEITLELYCRPILTGLPWSQLTDVTLFIWGLRLADFRQFMKQCNNLLSLKLLSPPISPRFEKLPLPSGVVIDLPTLQFLTLCTTGIQSDLDILEFLRAPSLKGLTVGFWDEQFFATLWNQSRFCDMLNRSGCTLEFLGLVGRISPVSLEKVFRELPSLTTLVVSSQNPIPGEIFDEMARGTLLGRLEHLKCTTSSPISFLRFLEYQSEHIIPNGYRGLSSADVFYGVVDDSGEFLQIYERLKRRFYIYKGEKLSKGFSLGPPKSVLRVRSRGNTPTISVRYEVYSNLDDWE